MSIIQSHTQETFSQDIKKTSIPQDEQCRRPAAVTDWLAKDYHNVYVYFIDWQLTTSSKMQIKIDKYK